MQIEVLKPEALTPELCDRWSALGSEAGLTSPFLSPEWVLACAAAQGPDARRARVAVLHEQGRIVGFLPVRLSGSAALPVGAPLCDYQGAVLEPGAAFDPRAVLRALKTQRFDFDHLLADQTALKPFFHGTSSSHVADLSDGYTAYAAARKLAGSDVLQDCAKKRRKLGRERGEVVFTAASVSADDFDTLIQWKRERYGATRQTDIFAAGWTLRLLKNLFERPQGDVAGKLFTLHAGGRLMAAHYALCTRDAMHAWFIGHDLEASRYSPGVVLIADILQWAAGQGVREFDLGAGDYRFKSSLASHQREVAYGYVGRLSTAALVRRAAYGVRDVAEALPLGRVSAMPGKLMRRLDRRRGLGGGWLPAR